MMKVSVKAEFHLYGVIKREGKWFVAHCPPLDVATQGRTREEARHNLIEASELFLESCLERGTLDQAFRELGFGRRRKFGRLPAGAFPITVPIPLGLEKTAPWRA